MTEPSEAAKAKAKLMCNSTHEQSWLTLARFVQEVSEAAKVVRANCEMAGDMPETAYMLAPFILPEPVDRLLIEAREIVADYFFDSPSYAQEIKAGRTDRGDPVPIALAALRRGVEIGKGETK